MHHSVRRGAGRTCGSSSGIIFTMTASTSLSSITSMPYQPGGYVRPVCGTTRLSRQVASCPAPRRRSTNWMRAAAERRHPTRRERVTSLTLQTTARPNLDDAFQGLPFEVAARFQALCWRRRQLSWSMEVGWCVLVGW